MEKAKKTIAILEDDHQLREVLTNFLTAKGFEVYGAPSGFDIVKDVFARKPDLIITDLGLQGASGDQVVKTLKVRNLLPQTPVIVISALGPDEIAQAVKSLEAVAALPKPFDNEKLLTLVKQHILGAPAV